MEKVLITSDTNRDTFDRPSRVPEGVWVKLKERCTDSQFQTFLEDPDLYIDAWDYFVEKLL